MISKLKKNPPASWKETNFFEGSSSVGINSQALNAELNPKDEIHTPMI